MGVGNRPTRGGGWRGLARGRRPPGTRGGRREGMPRRGKRQTRRRKPTRAARPTPNASETPRGQRPLPRRQPSRHAPPASPGIRPRGAAPAAASSSPRCGNDGPETHKRPGSRAVSGHGSTPRFPPPLRRPEGDPLPHNQPPPAGRHEETLPKQVRRGTPFPCAQHFLRVTAPHRHAFSSSGVSSWPSRFPFAARHSHALLC